MDEYLIAGIIALVLLSVVISVFYSYQAAVSTLSKKQTRDIIVVYKQGTLIKIMRITDGQITGVGLEPSHTYIYLVNSEILTGGSGRAPATVR